MSKTIAFLGLGVMGYPMAGHLARSGYNLRVFNRTSSKAQQWLSEYQGSAHRNPAEAAEGADVVMSCVGNDDDLRTITLAEHGAFSSMKKAAIFVDHTTASADIARELNEQANLKGISFLDAPVSGGQAGAQSGQLSVMVGGDKVAFERVKPVIEVFSKSVLLMGESGAGQLTKMVNQICIAGLVQGLSEGINFAEKAGLNPREVIAAISKGAAQSWQMENRYETMADGQYDFGFAVDWMRKDLKIALAEASNNGASLPVTALVDQFYADVQLMGGRRWDTSSLLARLRKF
jgi:3-hydroxyisobutyrate dehydrogenase